MTARRALTAAVVAIAACRGAPPGPALQILGDGPLPRAGDRLPTRSAIFDGTTVRLRGVRGDTLGVAVLRTDPIAAPIALAIEGASVQAFAVDDAVVDRPSTSMYGSSRGRGAYPERLTPAAQPIAAARLAWFDVAIDRATTAGRHAGTITVGAQRWTVELTVDAAEVAPIDAAPWVWAFYEPSELTGRDDDVEAERPYSELMRRYGVMATPELTSASWPARREFVAGAAFVPVWLPREPEALAAEVRTWRALLGGTGVQPFAIPIDEPRTDEAAAKVRALSAAVRAAGGGPGQFLFAVTHGPDPKLGDAIDIYIAPDAVRDRSVPRDRAWTYNGSPGWAGAMVVDDAGGGLRTWGWLGFAYDVPLWYVWDAVYWRDRHNRRRAPPVTHDLLRTPITFDDGGDHGALDGVLVHPDHRPSWRLTQLRRGLLDRALLEQLTLCAGRPVADAIVDTVVPRSGRPRWPRSDVGWEALRTRVLDALAACRAR